MKDVQRVQNLERIGMETTLQYTKMEENTVSPADIITVQKNDPMYHIWKEAQRKALQAWHQTRLAYPMT